MKRKEAAAAPNRTGRTVGRGLAFQLWTFGLALVLPLLLLLGILLHGRLRDAQEALRRHAFEYVRSATLAVDQELEALSALLGVLTSIATPGPQSDIDDLAERLRPVLLRVDLGLVIGRADGQVLLSLGTPSPDNPALHIPVGERPRVSDRLQPAQGGEGIFLVTRMLRRDDGPLFVSLVVPVARLAEALAHHALPSGWGVAVFDREGAVLTSGGVPFLGGRLPAALLERMAGREGLFRASLNGPALLAHRQSEIANWRVSVMLPAALAETMVWRPNLGWFLLAGGMLLLALALGWLLARRLARAVGALAEAARLLGRGEEALALPPHAPAELAAIEAALVENEGRLRRAVAAGGVATWEWDQLSETLTGSPGREALYGRPPGSLGTREALLAAIHPDDRPMLRLAIQAATRPLGDGHYVAEFRVVWPDGQVRWLRTQGGAVERDERGRIRRLAGVVMDVTAQHEAAERERLLTSEVDHRARNVLAVVQSILRLTRHDDQQRYAEAVEGRIAAMARAHTLLSRERRLGGEWLGLLGEELAPYLQAGRIRLEGEALLLAPAAVQPLAMVMHELLTNAVKHGALCLHEGRATLSWKRAGGRLELCWEEAGGPRVVAPPPRAPGFGRRLIETTVRGQLHGTVEWDWRPTGLIVRLRLPEKSLLRRQEGGGAPERAVAMPGRFAGRRVLLAEDEPSASLAIEGELRGLGCTILGRGGSAEQAMRLASQEAIDLAVLGVSLGGQPSFPVADLLMGRGVPVIFVTGYGDPEGQVQGERSAVLRRPIEAGALERAMARLMPPGTPAAPSPPGASQAGEPRFNPPERRPAR